MPVAPWYWTAREREMERRAVSSGRKRERGGALSLTNPTFYPHPHSTGRDEEHTGEGWSVPWGTNDIVHIRFRLRTPSL